MRILKQLLYQLLTFQLACGSFMYVPIFFTPDTVAAKKSESNGKSKRRLNEKRIGDLTPQQRNQAFRDFVDTSFDFLVRQSMLVQSLKDFDKIFLSNLKPNDRKFLLGEFKRLGLNRFASFRREGSSLVLQDKKVKLSAKWPNPGETKFEINGISWTYAKNKPLKPQVENLLKSLESKKHFSIYELLIPRADAAAGILAGLGITLISALVGLVANQIGTESFCKVADAVNYQNQTCLDRKKAIEQALYADAPALDAVADQGAMKWQSEVWQCPAKGSESQFSGRMRRIERQGGNIVTFSKTWLNVTAKFLSDGTPTDIYITRDREDEPEAQDKILVVHMTFDPTTRKPVNYRVPNPDYNPDKDPLGTPTLNLTPINDLTADQKTRMDTAQEIVTFINSRITICSNERLMASLAKAKKVNRGIATSDATTGSGGSGPDSGGVGSSESK